MKRIELHDIHLTYTLRRRGGSSIKDWVMAKVMHRPGPPAQHVHALRGVSFEVADGQRLGVIGHNGAGKSSLLRLLAGIYLPTSGTRVVRGRISSLFELGLGFEPDATGWENIRYRGYLQKESPKSIKEKIAEIAEFSELGPALDRPLRYYSSGMMIRLAFSIATTIKPEVLLVDEVLAAGDLGFQQKARQRMLGLMREARAIVVVTHDLKNLPQICDRVVWLDQGQVRMIGEAVETTEAYTRYMQERAKKPPTAAA